MPINRAYLGLGGNLGDPLAAMAAALMDLDEQDEIRVVAVSSVYRTPPWGKTDQPDFLNAVACLDTALRPGELLQRCLQAESQLKRVRQERWGPRTIDIDILLFGQTLVDEPGLRIPHPRMMDRAFVLVPLAEIAPDFKLEGMSVRARAAAIGQQGIERIDLPQSWWRIDR